MIDKEQTQEWVNLYDHELQEVDRQIGEHKAELSRLRQRRRQLKKEYDKALYAWRMAK